MDQMPIYYNAQVYSQWEAPVENALCSILYVSEQEVVYTTFPTRETSQIWIAPKEGIYYRYATCLVDPDSEKNKTIDLGFFQVYLDPPPQEEPPEEEEILNPPLEEIPEVVVKEEIPKPISKPKVEKSEALEPIPEPNIHEEVLGISKETKKKCNIHLLKKKKYEVIHIDCNIGFGISKGEYLENEGYTSILVEGTYNEKISSNISLFKCEPFNFFDFKTWGKCKLKKTGEIYTDIYPIYSGNILLENNLLRNKGFSFNKDTFSISSIAKETIEQKKPSILLNMYISFKEKAWIDFEYSFKKDISLEKITKQEKPFSFPLDRYIGVTQWHGCTKYQCPHKGIDFGARLNKVISVGDGTVIQVGYDKYGGECKQGGNFVIVKHTNGMYSTYFHLDHYNVKQGDPVLKGQLLGVSGNSGKWNCQNLGYHLHFETRKDVPSSTHVNPVEYINIDWNMINTIGKDVYPDRLSGDNPHPNF